MKKADEIKLEAAVDTGAEMLDEMQPGWHRKIDLSTLDMGSGFQCICGQLFMEQSRLTPYISGYDYYVHTPSFPRSDKCGFVYMEKLDDVSPGEQYSYLAELWVEKIEKRLANEGMMA